MQTAPLHEDVAGAPAGGKAFWLTSDDGVKIRIGVWNEGQRGTVLLFPGRTEYIEKYGKAAGEFAERGFATVVVDWRGQGLADRLLDDRAIGHVGEFHDYQRDVQAVLKAVGELSLPRPLFLVGHSMGGAIGMRALLDGMPFNAASFSAPMWGILMSPLLRPVALTYARLADALGKGHMLAPSTNRTTYVLDAPFDDNTLTTEEPMWAYMRGQVERYPDLSLGGPSLHWLLEAISECKALVAADAPATPTLTFLGTQERIVCSPAVQEVMGKWGNGTLHMVEGAEHEIMMETDATRKRFFDATAAHFAAHG